MQLNPYLTFNGDCEAAFKFYEQHLGGRITALIPNSAMPMGEPTSADWGSKVLHATIEIGGTVVMGSDAPPPRYEKPAGFMVSLSVTSTEEAQRLYAVLQEGGVISMPLAKTPWAEAFAMLADRFGIPWIINYEGKTPPAV